MIYKNISWGKPMGVWLSWLKRVTVKNSSNHEIMSSILIIPSL